jgi:hypothetical protein
MVDKPQHNLFLDETPLDLDEEEQKKLQTDINAEKLERRLRGI